MKKHKINLVISFFLLINISIIAQWEPIEFEWENEIRDIFTVNEYLFVTTSDENYENDQLYISTDDGDSFTNMTDNLPDPVQSFSARDLTYHKGEIYLAIKGDIYASSNLGTTWREIDHSVDLGSGPIYYRVVSLGSDGNVLYAGTDEFTAGFVVKSENDGVTWELAHSTNSRGVKKIEASDSYVYFRSENELFRSELNSDEWDEILVAGIGDFAVNSAGDSIMVLDNTINISDSLLISSDHGENFQHSTELSGHSLSQVTYAQGTFFIQLRPINFFDNDSTDGGIMYSNSSTNHTWMNISNEQYVAYASGMEANDRYLFIQYGDTLITRTHLSNFGVLTSVDQPEEVSLDFDLSQNYPNPFNPSTIISYSIPKQSNVSLKVYDILGKEVAELVNTEKPAGSYEVDFNAENLSSGIYFYTLKTNNSVLTKKMMLIK